jgi:hypothetical protein
MVQGPCQGRGVGQPLLKDLGQYVMWQGVGYDKGLFAESHEATGTMEI